MRADTICSQLICPLCHRNHTVFHAADQRRHFFRCLNCSLIFVPPTEYLTAAEEKAHYKNHRNTPNDEGYRQFLAKLFSPVHQILQSGSKGLDFGCGPGPTLHLLFEEAGHVMQIYDPLFFSDDTVLNQKYDFITASEVVEHLHSPREVLESLWNMLTPDGMLALMTGFVPDNIPFTKWSYKNDETHVCFYSSATFTYLVNHLKNARLRLLPDIAILKKTAF